MAGRTLLCVDDSPTMLRLVEMAMRSRPHVRVVTATEGRRGVALAVEHRPDLVLLDGTLPGLSGEEVLRELKSRPETSDIPVVIATGESRPEVLERFLAAGARECLIKPVGLDRLLALVDALGPAG